MNLQALIAQWLSEHPSKAYVDRGTICLPIESQHIESPKNHVWYVCKIEEDHIRLFNPAKRQFGDAIPAGLPTFFEQLDAIMKFYGTYAP